jgi:uncharacterized phage protein gp47/JayE
MPLFAETDEKIFGDIMFDIVNDTNLTRTSRGSKTRAVAQAVSKKMGRMWGQFDINIVQAYLEGAEGRYLDFIGDMMGLERLGDRPASVTRADQIVKIYVDLGTFGDINGGSPINIPSGTIISSLSGGTGIRYVMPYTVILPSDSSEFYVAVEAIRPGSSSNVGVGTLIHHDFTDYSDSVNSSLLVTNESEIAFGRDLEVDTNYKFRIANQIVASENANQTAVRLAALVVPGVADLAIIPFNRGIGTYDLLLKATTPRVPSGLITAVEESVTKVTSMGIVPLVRAPTETGMSMVGTLTLRRAVSAGEQTSIIQAVTDNVTNYINNLDIAEEFIVNEVVERVLSTSDIIKNLGVANKPLDSVYIYRSSKLEDNKVRETLIGDFTPEADEKLLVEDSSAGTTPILFRIA